MKEKKHDEAQKSYILIRCLGAAVLVFFMLVSIAGAALFTDITNNGESNASVVDTAANTVTTTTDTDKNLDEIAVTPSEIQSTQITTTGSASDPQIYGEKIVYEDNRNGKSDIYMYDLSTQQETRISTSGEAKYPAIYGDRIVYEDNRNKKSDIYMYDLSTSQETQISTNGTAYSGSELSGPEICNGRIVWQEYTPAGTYGLFVYDIFTQQRTQIVEKTIDDIPWSGFYGFAVHGDKIVYNYFTSDETSLTMAYDLSTQQTTEIGGMTSANPDIYGDRVVCEEVSWEGDPEDSYSESNIYAYDLSTQEEIQVSASGKAHNPAIYSDRIVWEDDRNGQNIYMYDLSNSKETQITTSGSAASPDIYENRIVWVDGDNIYMGTPSETIVSEIEVSDNRLREASPNSVYKNSAFIDVGGMNSVRYRDVLQFDLSQYNSDTSIENAALSLYWYYPAGKTRSEDTVIEIYRPASSWNSDYVSWNKKDKNLAWKNPGGDWYDKNGVLQGNTPYATITIKGSSLPDNKYYTLDVTDLVKEYVSGKYENTGFLIKARTESNNYIAFYSSDWTNEIQKPKITVTEKEVPYEINMTQVTNTGSASDPHIYGSRIVYEDSRNGKSDVYMYDLSTQQETRISTSGEAKYPAIYGDRIVYEDNRNEKSEIYMYDLSTSQETQISTNGTAYSGDEFSGPEIYNDKIVWQEHAPAGTYNLFVYDLSTQQKTQIAEEAIDDIPWSGFYGFAVHGSKIVYNYFASDEITLTYVYDLSTQQTTKINDATLYGPDIYGDRIVGTGISWEGDPEESYYYYDIYVYDLNTQQEIQVSTSGKARNSVIYSDRIVWKDDRNGQNIYMYDLSNSKETQITTSGSAASPDIYENRIVWIDGNNIYMGTLSETIVSEIEVSDNRLREASPNSVYKNSAFVDVGGMNNVRYRDVMQFDLSQYNSDTSIENAALSLYWYYPEGKTRPGDTIVEVYRPASSWNSDYVSWNKKDKNVAWTNAGGDWYDKNGILQGSTPYATITIKGSTLPDNKYYELDVTDLVKEYASGKYENTGILIKARTESNNYIAFYSSDYGDENKVPKLQLAYS
jgi:beta propeller repeat protein